MSTGNVTTARGDILDLDDLIAKSKRPIGFKEAKSEIEVRPIVKRTPLNVRGHMPSAPTAVVPKLSEEATREVAKIHQKAPISAATKGRPAKSLSELTALRVDRPRGIRVKPGESVKPGDGAALAEGEVLQDIMGSLNQVAPRAAKAAEAYEERQEKLAKRRRTGKLTAEEQLAIEAEDE